MSYRIEKNDEVKDLIFEGWEQGIAPSPHKGVANIQSANIATEEGEVMCSYARALQSQAGTAAATFSITVVDTNHLSTSANLTNGVWITVGAGITGLTAGNYYIQNSNGTSTSAATSFQVSQYYNGSLVTGFSDGPATGNLVRAMSQPIAHAVEPYFTTTQQYRYYILDSAGLVWVYDTARVDAGVVGKIYWFLPDTSITYFGSDTAPSGIFILNGWLHVLSGNKIWLKETVNLGGTTSTTTLWVEMTNVLLMSKSTTTNPHFGFVGHQGKAYYTDGVYLGSIFPNTSQESGVANIQSYASYTASTTTGSIATLIGGSLPSTGANVGATGFSRIPAVFFTDQAGTQPTNLSVNVVYFISYSTANENFEVYAAITGGSAIDIAAGAAGNQYFNTYFPIGTHSAYNGDHTLMTFTAQRLNLPFGEVSKRMVEIGNTIIVGCISNALYPWNQVDVTPGNVVLLPENNTQQMLTVNQMAYVFAGNKGNVYITDGNVASLILKVPDYCAGLDGTASSYKEPVFTWGGTMYLRGRVYFSILDQTTAKAGNCGGVWSFYPTQNLYSGQDTGIALRLENQNSYGTYSGVATVLIPSNDQTVQSPQYWSGWYSSVSSATYGIDTTDTGTSTSAVIETDLAPVGTLLNKKTYEQVEYKLAAPLVAGESVTIKWRANSTDAYASMGSAITESTTGLSGYFQPNFDGIQWIQFEITLSPITGSTSSLVRLVQVRVR